MKKIIINLSIIAVMLILFQGINAQTIKYTMPEEIAPHEGTWLQWPHNHTYPPYWREDLEPSWIEMTRELVAGENVHIIAYDSDEHNHIVQVLNNAGVPLTNVDFFIHPNNDVWVRDNGPIFVYNSIGNLRILDWGFNGWGEETPYELCDVIPALVSEDIEIPDVNLSAMVLEGGSIEIDGKGTLMATKSAIINPNRNPSLTQAQIEEYMTINLGVTNFIWLDGVPGLEITDMHIDGFARFNDSTTIVTMDSLDLIYWEVPPSDISILYDAQDVNGNPYNFLHLPLTVNNVVTTCLSAVQDFGRRGGENLGYKGSYVNYYTGNTVVLVPTYNDPNDAVAISLLQTLYSSRTVVGIDVRNLYSQGGMVHCVTQQQPVGQDPNGIIDRGASGIRLLQNSPNPFSTFTTISFTLKEKSFARLEVYNSQGKSLATLVNSRLPAGDHTYTLVSDDYKNGIYTYTLTIDSTIVLSKKMMVTK